MFNGYEIFYRLVKSLSVGDEVSFKKSGSHRSVKGELRRLAATNENCLITIYSYFDRKEHTFSINSNLELYKTEILEENGSDELVYYDLSKGRGASGRLRWLAERVMLFLLLFSLVAPLLPEIKLHDVNYSYAEFLEKSFSLSRLYDVVTTRIRYTYDADDTWLTPAFSWQLRQGDCEELALIYSDYLTHNNIESYVVGLYYNDRPAGHAVVFARYEGSFYMIDLTKAIEALGIRKLKEMTTLEEAVRYYKAHGATVFKVPEYNSDKKGLYNIGRE